MVRQIQQVLPVCAIILSLAVGIGLVRSVSATADSAAAAASSASSAEQVTNRRALTADALRASTVQNECVSRVFAAFDQSIALAITSERGSPEQLAALQTLRTNDITAQVSACIDDHPIPVDEPGTSLPPR